MEYNFIIATYIDKMIEKNNGELNNDFILDQSRKVDKLIVTYQRLEPYCILKPGRGKSEVK